MAPGDLRELTLAARSSYADPMTHDVTVRFKKLDARATTPVYHSDCAAGMDLYACLPRGLVTTPTVLISRGQIVKIPLGFCVEIPPGYEGQVRPRSGLASKHGLTLPNSPGTVDSDYRGEMFVALINLSDEPYEIQHGDRIAQMVIAPVTRAALVEVDELSATGRGEGGFGSTGR